MRNLKKVLSLTLALVMLLGMMVVGAGAVETSFPDNDEIGEEYKEAVAVVSALKIFEGDENGNLNPKDTLTRAEAAKLLAVTMIGDAAKGLAGEKDSAFFNDMKNHWASGYVDYCASVGIIKGTSETTMNPSGTLKGVEFAAMLLRAAGVPEADTFTGAGWETKVIAAAGKYGVADVTTADVTREAAAKMSLEGILVSPSGEKTYKVGDETFASASEAYFYQQAEGNSLPIEVVPAKDSLASQLKLDSYASTDAFGRTTKVWTVDGKDKVTVESGAAALTFTTKKSDLSKELKGYKFDSLKKVNVLTNGVAEDGETDDSVASDDFTSAADVATATGNGKLVEIYADSSKNVTKIVIVEYKVGTLGVATSKTRTTYTVAGQSGIDYVDEDTTDTVAFHGEAEKDDVVTAAKVGTTLHIYPTTAVTGTLSAINTSAKTITVDGEKYTVGTALNNGTDAVAMADFDGFLGKDDVNVYIDVNGVAVYAKSETVAPTEYCYVVSAAGTVEVSVDGKTPKIEARVVLTDGTVGVYKLAVKTAADGNSRTVGGVTVHEKSGTWADDLKSGWDTDGTGLPGNAYLYSLDEDNVMTLTAIDAMSAIDDGETVTGALSGYAAETKATVSTKTVLFNESTKFVVYNSTDKTASVIEGRSALGTGTTGLGGPVVVAGSSASTGVAKIVFVNAGTVGSADSGSYVYVDTSKYYEEIVNKVKTRFYTGIGPDGEEVTVTKPASADLSGAKLWKYNTENEITAAFEDSNVLEGTAAVTEGLIDVGASGTYYPIPEDLVPVYIDEDGTQVDGNEVFVVLKSNKVEAIFVTDASAETAEPVVSTKATAAKTNVASVGESQDLIIVGYTVTTGASDDSLEKELTTWVTAWNANRKAVTHWEAAVDEDKTGVVFTFMTAGEVESTGSSWTDAKAEISGATATNGTGTSLTYTKPTAATAASGTVSPVDNGSAAADLTIFGVTVNIAASSTVGTAEDIDAQLTKWLAGWEAADTLDDDWTAAKNTDQNGINLTYKTTGALDSATVSAGVGGKTITNGTNAVVAPAP